MKKYLSSIALILLFVVYVSYRRIFAPDVAPVVTPSQPFVTPPVASPNVAGSSTGNGRAQKKNGGTGTSPVPAAPAPSVQTGQYRDGVYTGSSVDAYYGSVQVQVSVSGGRLADVQFLQYPSDRATSNRINTRAMSQLRGEAIANQSAPVDVVSGATETTGAFNQSLASALSQAQ